MFCDIKIPKCKNLTVPTNCVGSTLVLIYHVFLGRSLGLGCKLQAIGLILDVRESLVKTKQGLYNSKQKKINYRIFKKPNILMADFSREAEKIRPKIGLKRPTMRRVNIRSCTLTLIHSVHRWLFPSPLDFCTNLRKKKLD